MREPTSSTDSTGPWRILDANANRAGEAFRVVEDILRFGLNDRHLTEQAKSLRHRLQAALGSLDDRTRLTARDAIGDVGPQIQTATEFQRESIESVLAANWKRAQQSLRSMEEVLKLLDVAVALRVEQLRYQSYEIERNSLLRFDASHRLADVRLCVLTDACASESLFEQRIRPLIEAEVDWIQLRDKSLSDRELLARGQQLSHWVRGTQTRWLMNDRVDLAVGCGADGVHLGQTDLPLPIARRLAGATLLIGVSTHSVDEARRAVDDGADYIGVGPIFPSRTKSFAATCGTQLIRDVLAATSIPMLAIGGITLENLASVLAAGAQRVAVGDAVVAAESPGRAAAQILHKMSNR